MDRPLVVNSLLCFIHNFRESPKLRPLVKEFFPPTDIEEAQSLLEERMHMKGDVFSLYEQLSSSGRMPIFAATDLSVMPLTLLVQEEKHEMLREMRALRRFISDALNGRMDESPSRVYDAEEVILPSKMTKLPTSASSPEVSPCTPLIMDNNSSSSCASTEKSSDSELRVELNPREMTTLCESKSLDDSPKDSCLKRKRNNGRSLDETVAKLNNLQRNRSEPRESSPPPPTPVVATTPASWTSPMHIDPHTYLAVIQKIMHNNGATTYFNPSVVSPSCDQLKEQSRVEEEDEKVEDCEENNKMYEDSSPSPSDDTREEYELDNDMEKPFICPHSNCAKRFANKFLLKKHQFIHTGLRPHTCPYCSKRFNRKDNLLRHKKTHMAGAEDSTRRQALDLLLNRHDSTSLKDEDEE